MDMSKYKGMFISEAKEHLQAMSQLIVSLEKDSANKEDIEALLEKPVVFYKGHKLEIKSTIKKLERENITTSSLADNSYHKADTGPNQSEEKNHAR